IGSMTSAGATKATTFNWSPEISPKNKDLSKSFSKKLDDGKGHNSVLAKDGTLDYTIKAKVNRTKSGDLTKDDISGFAVFDDFPTAAFGTNVESSAVKSVSFGDGDDAELTSNTDYEVSIVKASSEADGKNL
ncbi:LPXTG cell wall anchor domain-containing protein, partial [Gardnerella vaginalis]